MPGITHVPMEKQAGYTEIWPKKANLHLPRLIVKVINISIVTQPAFETSYCSTESDVVTPFVTQWTHESALQQICWMCGFLDADNAWSHNARAAFFVAS